MSKNKTVRNVFFLVFCLFACVSLGYAESCSSKGQVQYKYTASGCSYTTQSRTCCSNGSWSAWDKPCPVAECKNGETKQCGSAGCGQKTCENGRWSACETPSYKLGYLADEYDTYCTTGGHNVYCCGLFWIETLKCCGLKDSSESICKNFGPNCGRQDWSQYGAIEYVK